MEKITEPMEQESDGKGRYGSGGGAGESLLCGKLETCRWWLFVGLGVFGGFGVGGGWLQMRHGCTCFSAGWTLDNVYKENYRKLVFGY